MSRSRPARRTDARAAAAAFLSFLVPGLGQGYNGQWLLAAALVAPIGLLLGLAVIVAMDGTSSLLGRLLDSRVLFALIVLDLALLGWRLVAILQAHVVRGRLALRSWPGVVTMALLLVTVGMHLVPAAYAAKAIDTIGAVALEGGGSLLDRNDPGRVPVTAPSDQPEIDERVTVLLVGVDFTAGRSEHLTDTMLVATLDPATGEGAMVSVPRDLYGVPLGDGRIYEAKLNSLMARASADPATYPAGGPATLKAAIGTLLGTKIHYFAAIDMDGMRQVIDVIGGVDVDVARAIHDARYFDATTGQRGWSIDAGRHHLDGSNAMAYVRSRYSAGESDFTRAERQQQVLTAVAAKLTAGNLLATLPGLLDAVKANVATDIPGSRIAALAEVVSEAKLGSMERVVLTPDDGYVVVEPHSAAGYILLPDLERIDALGRRLFGRMSGSVR